MPAMREQINEDRVRGSYLSGMRLETKKGECKEATMTYCTPGHEKTSQWSEWCQQS
jgi:hypothetical protein